MEQPSGSRQVAAWRASFQQKYLTHLVAMLHRRKIDQRATRLSARTRSVKLAADLSLAMTMRSRSAWRRAIFRKCLFRFNKFRCQRQGVKSRGNFNGKKRSVSAKARPCKSNAACYNAYRQLLAAESRLMGTTSIRSSDNCDEEARGTVDSRMQVLRALVPGSRQLDTQVFLEEAADYILALKMQVQAMQALAEWYSYSNGYPTCHVSI